jgi:hypothetical protein
MNSFADSISFISTTLHSTLIASVTDAGICRFCYSFISTTLHSTLIASVTDLYKQPRIHQILRGPRWPKRGKFYFVCRNEFTMQCRGNDTTTK